MAVALFEGSFLFLVARTIIFLCPSSSRLGMLGGLGSENIVRDPVGKARVPHADDFMSVAFPLCPDVSERPNQPKKILFPAVEFGKEK